jgi:hypothetical protein
MLLLWPLEGVGIELLAQVLDFELPSEFLWNSSFHLAPVWAATPVKLRMRISV